MNELIVHQVDITHYRLVELSRLADQAKPFYDWIERAAKRITGSPNELSEILMTANRAEIGAIVNACYAELVEKRPFLFDGIGRVYPHGKACFYFFSWIIRDAPQQRLAPLIARMKKAENITGIVAESDSIVELIYEYRACVKGFSWLTVREVVMDRLEGSRRSIKGHNIEASVRVAIITAFQNYFAIYAGYGKYKKIVIADRQIKIGNHTIDVSVELTPVGLGPKEILLMPIKTRETEGGGHSHIFTRDIIAAVRELKEGESKYYIIATIVALNWSVNELGNMNGQIDKVYHFNMNPNKFVGFDEASQVQLNKYIQGILDNG